MPFKIMIILLHFRQARMNKFHQFSILTTLVQYREKIRTCRRDIFFSYLYIIRIKFEKEFLYVQKNLC